MGSRGSLLPSAGTQIANRYFQKHVNYQSVWSCLIQHHAHLKWFFCKHFIRAATDFLLPPAIGIRLFVWNNKEFRYVFLLIPLRQRFLAQHQGTILISCDAAIFGDSVTPEKSIEEIQMNPLKDSFFSGRSRAQGKLVNPSPRTTAWHCLMIALT